MEKILVTGSDGQLGSELRLLSVRYSRFQWFFANREQVSLDNLSVLEKQIKEINPNIIINCAAYTAVDKAESESDLANIINNLAVGVIASYSLKNNVKLLHISTDYVFDGTSGIALSENASTSPINIYGQTKLAGEQICLKKNPNSIIIRTSWVYSIFGNNFVKTMSRLMQERDRLNVVNDQIGSPTYAADLAQVILAIITHSNWQPGIYNFSNEGEISWYQFALAIREIGNYNCDLCGIPTLSYTTPAKRPAYSLLDKSKIKEIYQVDVPYYKDSLKKMMSL
jgi:dTDP-4-dehydrorhamnose reductase